jgi:glycosyltransferase involved in cell wall biosynthesis
MNDETSHEPFFSIIVPSYNRSERLLKALDSILAQHHSNFEIIIVDDGSTDDTRDVVNKLIIKDHRIKYFFKENQERSIARNYGIRIASGMYVCFLDSDDILYFNHFSVAYDLLRCNSFPEVGHLGYQVINEKGEILIKKNSFDHSVKKTLIYENILSVNAIFIRRDIAQEINFIDSEYAILSEDWYLWLRLAARFSFHFDNTITSAVVSHSERSLMNIDPKKLIASTNIVVAYLKKDLLFLKTYGAKASYHFANHYTFLTMILASTKGKKKEAIKFLLKAIGYDPKVIFRKRFLATVKHIIK